MSAEDIFPCLLSYSPFLRYSGFISLYFFFMLQYILPCPVSPSMFPILFDFSCLFLITSVLHLHLPLSCITPSFSTSGLYPHHLVLDRGCRKREEENQLCTVSRLLVSCVSWITSCSCVVHKETNRQMNPSRAIALSSLFSSSHLSLLFLSRPLI